MSVKTLNLYLTGKFFLWLMITSLAFLALATLGDYLEMVAFASRHGQGSVAALYYTGLRMPLVFLQFAPFIFLFGTVLCLIRLSQAQELVVIRAAGISVWQFLTPFIATSLIIGGLLVALVEPLGTHNFKAFQEIEKQLSGQKAEVQISDNGIWLREALADGSYILHGQAVVDLDKQIFNDISVLMFDAQGVFTHRLRAAGGQLLDNVWQLKNVEIIVTGQAVERRPTLTLESQFDGMNLAQQFNSPKTINVWQLADYIAQAQAAGSDVARHEVRFHSLISLPFMLVAMVLVAACFSLPTGRLFSASATMGAAVLAGFVLYMGADFIASLASLHILPPLIASWTPSLIAGLLAVGYLLSAEDG